ncbi:hypothetical protein IMY05_C4646000100 [Salix suchowensis]|nr:hypothetical protein IMY05_C4646000100 [Salix suchowensis]
MACRQQIVSHAQTRKDHVALIDTPAFNHGDVKITDIEGMIKKGLKEINVIEVVLIMEGAVTEHIYTCKHPDIQTFRYLASSYCTSMSKSGHLYAAHPMSAHRTSAPDVCTYTPALCTSACLSIKMRVGDNEAGRTHQILPGHIVFVLCCGAGWHAWKLTGTTRPKEHL